MFNVTPVGEIRPQNDKWLSELEKGGFTHWVIHENFRVLYNELSYWAKVFREMEDGSLIHLMDLNADPEYDEEYDEEYLPNVTEGDIRELFEWYEE